MPLTRHPDWVNQSDKVVLSGGMVHCHIANYVKLYSKQCLKKVEIVASKQKLRLSDDCNYCFLNSCEVGKLAFVNAFLMHAHYENIRELFTVN